MKSLIAGLRRLVLPFGATTGTRIVLDGVTGVISFYNSLNELVGQLGPNQWFTGTLNGAHAQLDPFGGIRIFDGNGQLAAILDSSGLYLSNTETGEVFISLTPDGLTILDPQNGRNIELFHGTPAAKPPSPGWQGLVTALPGATSDTPPLAQFTGGDLELRYIARWANANPGTTTTTPLFGYVNRMDVNSSGLGWSMSNFLASGFPAVSNFTRTFTNSFVNWQFDIGMTVALFGGATPPVFEPVVSQTYVVDPAPAFFTHHLSLGPPPGTAVGDVLIAFVAFGSAAGSVPTSWSIPEGWKPLGTKSSIIFGTTSTLSAGAWWKVATGTEPPSYTVTVESPGSGTKKYHIVIARVSNPGVLDNPADIRIGQRSLSRGVFYPERFESVGTSVAYTTATTDMATIVPVLANRAYAVYLNAHTTYAGAAPHRFQFNCFVNGARIGEFDTQNALNVNDLEKHVHGRVPYYPTTDGTVTIDLRLVRVLGAGTVSLVGVAGNPRFLEVVDHGARVSP